VTEKKFKIPWSKYDYIEKWIILISYHFIKNDGNDWVIIFGDLNHGKTCVTVLKMITTAAKKYDRWLK